MHLFTGNKFDSNIARVEPNQVRIVVQGDSTAEGFGSDMSRLDHFPYEYKNSDQIDGSLRGMQGWAYHLRKKFLKNDNDQSVAMLNFAQP